MKLKIIREPVLSKKHVDDLITLYEVCNAYDDSQYVFDEDEDFKKADDVNVFLLYEDSKLISSIVIFAPRKREAEIIALTLPVKRGKGYFTQLLKYAEAEIIRRGINSILYVCDSYSKEGIEVVEHINSQYEYSEFLMSFNNSDELNIKLREDIKIDAADPIDADRLSDINSIAFKNEKDESLEIIKEFLKSSRRTLYSIKYQEKVIGMIGTYDEALRAYIHGFCIDPEFQKRGIGKYVLRNILNRLPKNKTIELEVQADNRNALGLYENVGFSIDAEFKYYRYLPGCSSYASGI